MLCSILYKIKMRGGVFMIEKIAKMAEDCAKRSASSGSYIIAILHQPKMPKSLIKKDEE